MESRFYASLEVQRFSERAKHVIEKRLKGLTLCSLDTCIVFSKIYEGTRAREWS